MEFNEKIEFLKKNPPTPMQKKVWDIEEGAHSRYDDPVQDLARSEDKHRQVLREMGVEEKLIPLLADIYSTQELEKMELRKDSLFDKMTGIYNRNTFDNLVWKLVDIEKREEKNCSFLLIDFDHFKQVNDKYGHPAGDEALRQLSKTIKDIIRESDVLFRYGGEEFVVFLPNIDVAVAKEIAEKIREGVKNQTINIEDKNGQKLQLKKTITIGCASMNQVVENNKNDHGEEFNQALVKEICKLADNALYEGKQGSEEKEGRDQVVACKIEEYQVDYKKNRIKK